MTDFSMIKQEFRDEMIDCNLLMFVAFGAEAKKIIDSIKEKDAYTFYGEYPQEVVSNEMERELEENFSSGGLKNAGKLYGHDLFEYNGKRYARVVASVEEVDKPRQPSTPSWYSWLMEEYNKSCGRTRDWGDVWADDEYDDSIDSVEELKKVMNKLCILRRTQEDMIWDFRRYLDAYDSYVSKNNIYFDYKYRTLSNRSYVEDGKVYWFELKPVKWGVSFRKNRYSSENTDVFLFTNDIQVKKDNYTGSLYVYDTILKYLNGDNSSFESTYASTVPSKLKNFVDSVIGTSVDRGYVAEAYQTFANDADAAVSKLSGRSR